MNETLCTLKHVVFVNSLILWTTASWLDLRRLACIKSISSLSFSCWKSTNRLIIWRCRKSVLTLGSVSSCCQFSCINESLSTSCLTNWASCAGFCLEGWMGDASLSHGCLCEGRIGDREEVPGPLGVSGDERGLVWLSSMLGVVKSSLKGVRELCHELSISASLMVKEHNYEGSMPQPLVGSARPNASQDSPRSSPMTQAPRRIPPTFSALGYVSPLHVAS